ncbi:selenocysteine-specific translation elongation factor [Desulfovibrio desulfuricans]|uniref:Selenocysteine-specific elongation factor n=1 Tax=Desulfovibrio desulfuricans TaxID=876 RepID=A0A4P7UIH8_DESDE|nr:selenocysteine-specific translation elongation factor [Desulfovibrio desulfuricans]QCC84554.1 selenocysteine-specific translation elongation factor [Desulfovibrio desulfuricans]
MAVVLGTAGHIDHGKTSLVRALTGIDCDRLQEEKRRGITIELGFAWVDLPGGERMGIVDVPGHERFVKNMVAGAAGVDMVMLVIAADEGIMPQTREHLEICSLLGIRTGLVALTKTDMVDADWLEMVQEEVRGFLAGTFLDGAPIFPVSATTGEGIDALRDYLVRTAADLPAQRRSDIFRLPVDRVFSMKGHGTVVTGTVISGVCNLGDELRFMPADLPTRARGLQRHGKPADSVQPGQRCAVNVQGLDVDDIDRGFVLARPGELFPSSRWLVRLTCLSSAPRALRQRVEIHFHHGTRECAARVVFRDRDKLAPGETALAELRFKEPMVGVFGDHCVLRAYSPLRTVAGGLLVSPLPPELRAKDPELADKLRQLQALPELHNAAEAMGGGKAEAKARDEARAQMLGGALTLCGAGGADEARLRALTGLARPAVEAALQMLSTRGEALCWDKESRCWIAKIPFEKLLAACLERGAELHRREPLKPGFTRGALCTGWSRNLPPKLVQKVLDQAMKQGLLVTEGEGLRLQSHIVSLAADQAGLRQKLLDAHASAGLTPPNAKDVLEALGVTPKEAAPVLHLLCESGDLVKIKDGLYYHGPVLTDILDRVRGWFASHDNLDVAGLKELLGLSRKFLIALLEYMDNERITVRVGDQRRYRGR